MRIDRVKFIGKITKKGITLKKLSELSNVSRQTLSYIKQGKSCTDEVGKKIAKALNCDVKELLED